MTPTQPFSCDGALSDLILQAARQALPNHLSAPDCGERNAPLIPLMEVLVDAVKTTASAISDNAWDSGPALPPGWRDDLTKGLQAAINCLNSATEAF